MLSGKSITFEKLDQPGNEDWQRVSLEDDVKVIEKKQVRLLLSCFCISPTRMQGSNGILYIIDGTVSPN